MWVEAMCEQVAGGVDGAWRLCVQVGGCVCVCVRSGQWLGGGGMVAGCVCACTVAGWRGHGGCVCVHGGWVEGS